MLKKTALVLITLVGVTFVTGFVLDKFGLLDA
jgi:hypothetical protein